MWCGLYDSIPTGWLLCDGSEINRTTYADLFSAIGEQFGSTGATTFTLPLFQDIFPRSPASSTSCGATGGEDTVSLTEAELASHSHTASVTDAGHTHTLQTRGNSGTAYTNYVMSVNNPIGTATTSSSTTGVTVSNTSTGSGTAHENKPAFLEVLFIIKT
jgi:microcystin-dependent protein